MAADTLDLYQRLEREVRTPKRPLLLDAFLPPPESIASAVTPPPPAPEPTPEEAGFLARLQGEEPAAEPAAKPAKKRRAAPAKKKEEAPKSLQEEIAEFMNRDQPALAPEDDLDSLLNSSLDPNVDPKPDK